MFESNLAPRYGKIRATGRKIYYLIADTDCITCIMIFAILGPNCKYIIKPKATTLMMYEG
jgi:hypothetical protein